MLGAETALFIWLSAQFFISVHSAPLKLIFCYVTEDQGAIKNKTNFRKGEFIRIIENWEVRSHLQKCSPLEVFWK